MTVLDGGVLECVKEFISDNSKCTTKSIKQVIHEIPPYTFGQMIYHCSTSAAQAGLTEDEAMKIVTDVRRINAE